MHKVCIKEIEVIDLSTCPCAQVCAPYSALQGYKLKVKLTPGTQKKGKGGRQARGPAPAALCGRRCPTPPWVAGLCAVNLQTARRRGWAAVRRWLCRTEAF